MDDAHLRKAQLEKELASVQASLVELINRDYAQFVSLSSDLVGIDTTVDQLAKPLKGMLKDVESVEQEVEAELHVLEQQLQRRREIKQEKAMLQNILSLAAAVDKLENLIQPLKAAMAAGQHVPVEQLERVASEFTHVDCYAARCKGTDHHKHLQPRIVEMQSWIDDDLASRLRDALAAATRQRVHSLLRIYHLIGRISSAEIVVQRQLFAPAALESADSLRPITTHNLQSFYAAIVSVWRDRGACVCGSAVLSNDRLLVNAFLPAVVPVITNACDQITSVVHPDFRQNYLTTLSFLADLGAVRPCGDDWRTSSSCIALMHAWDIRSYAALRRNEIAGDVENAIADKPCELLDPSDISFAPFAALHRPIVRTAAAAVTAAWSPHIFVPQTRSVAWTLTIQVVLRLEAHVRSLSAAAPLTQSTAAADTATTRLQSLIDALPEVLEAHMFAETLPAFFQQAVSPQLEGAVALRDDITGTAEELLAAMTEARDAHMRAMAAAAASAAEDAVDALRQDLLRVFKKPTAPSANVSVFGSPLRELHNALSAHANDPSIAHSLMVEAVTPALTAYHAMVKKWFDSKNAKIRQQIKLDVQDIIKQIRSLEAEPVDSAEWTELLESIDML